MVRVDCRRRHPRAQSNFVDPEGHALDEGHGDGKSNSLGSCIVCRPGWLLSRENIAHPQTAARHTQTPPACSPPTRTTHQPATVPRSPPVEAHCAASSATSAGPWRATPARPLSAESREARWRARWMALAARVEGSAAWTGHWLAPRLGVKQI
jgi:hypothetical protein